MTIVPGQRPHTFHVCVMGTGFTIDAPLRVAKYGIDSAMSLVDDVLVEQMRKLHGTQAGEPYREIANDEEDCRARRITAYLNLLDFLIHRQVEALQASAFVPGSEITRYFELLPDAPLARDYREMLATADPAERFQRQERLRALAAPGSIDVNIMAKSDRDVYRHGEKLPPMFSPALSALRGYAESTLRSSIVFSAGFNPRLYSYAAEFGDFFPDENSSFKKKITLKVSDYHSAAVQGRFLAKRGLWISEYRIESGLNCGGHAFATQGLLLGPILEEFKRKKTELIAQLYATYAKALTQRNSPVPKEPPSVRLTVQGGIGTAAEDALLRELYAADGTGWATPFLLVPEVTNVDREHLEKLCAATEDDVYLSDSSPFGMPFWNLRTSSSEETRRKNIAAGRPGSRCVKGHVKLWNTEFTELPICTASRGYQKLKLERIEREDLPEAKRAAVREAVLHKSCICHDLAGGATIKNGIDAAATPAVCCGPNIVNFSKVATLEEMVGHIYGRTSLLNGKSRPHFLLREIELYLDFLGAELRLFYLGLSLNPPTYFVEFKQNLLDGVAYYRDAAQQLALESPDAFLDELSKLRETIEKITVPDETSESGIYLSEAKPLF
ncbi:MAG: hypothetical protein IT426_13215 [Pirellulales bacterium]|nr:hypothetical protein [Pirellulales bacterium]